MRCSRAVVGAFIAALVSASSTVAAQSPGDDARAKARVVGQQGLAYFDQGKYIEALERFEAADALMKAPTLGLMAARCLEKLGRIVEASERYLQVSRIALDPNATDVFKRAVASAAKEREALLPRIPSIEIVLEGSGAPGASVRIDGRAVPQAMVGVRTPINPGDHRIEAKGAGGAVAFERVRVVEKQVVRLVLTLRAPGTGAQSGAAKAGGGAGAGSSGVSASMGLGKAAGKRGAIDEQTRATARVIGEEGLSFYDQGKYVDALDRFERADALIHAPTLGLMAARSLVKLGRLVEASDRYEDVTEVKLEAGASDAFKEAQATAAKERDALLPRIPIVEVSVEGQGAADVSTLMVDGQKVPAARLGSARPISARIPIDPGDHRIEVKARSGEAFKRVSLSEGGSARVVLTMSPTAEKQEAPGAAVARGGAASGGGGGGASGGSASGGEEPSRAAAGEQASAGDSKPHPRGKTQQTIGWVSLGVGAAGVTLGAITGGVASSKRGDLNKSCNVETRVCPSGVADEVGTYNTLRHVSTAGFIVGGVGLAAGAVLLITVPRGGARYSTGSVKVSPWVGLGSAGVRGSF